MEEHRFIELCKKGDLFGAQQFLQVNPHINISADNEESFREACSNGHLDVCQWLLQIKPDINISADNEEPFREACINGHLDVCQLLQSLKPYLYVIEYDENEKYKGYKIREKEEANWERRKYALFLSSNKEEDNLLYRLPTDVAKMVLQFV